MLRSRAGLGLQQAASALYRKKEEKALEEEEGEEDRGSSSHDRHHQAEKEFVGRDRSPPTWSAFCLLLEKKRIGDKEKERKGTRGGK